MIAMKLDQLPEIVLRRICDFLLSAKEVRQPASADKGYVVKYPFHTAIMRVSKSIHSLAQGVFLLNHFVMISTNWHGLAGIIDGYGLWIWRDKLAKFKRYHARLNIKARGAKAHQKLVKYMFFLVCLDQIEDLTWVLRLFELGSELSIAFRFEIKPGVIGFDSSMPLMKQRDLLDPFTKLQGVRQICSVSGAVDLTLAKRVEAIMSPKLTWIRARAWAWYEVASRLKHRGDDAFRDQNFRSANSSWTAMIAFSTQINSPMIRFTTSKDANLQISRGCLTIITCINANLARLYLGWTEDDSAWYELVMTETPSGDVPAHLVLPVSQLALAQFVGAIAAFALRKTGTAHRMMSDIVRQTPGTDMYEQGLDIVSKWMAESKLKKKTRNRRDQSMELLLDLLPNEPLASPKVLDRPVESQLAFESYVLEKLGYQGDQLTWLVEHAGHDLNDPQILNKKEADAFVEERKKQLARGEDCIIIGTSYAQPQPHQPVPVFGFAMPLPGSNSGMTPEMVQSIGGMMFG